MPDIEVPRNWNDMPFFVRKYNLPLAQREELEILRGANPNAVFREFPGNIPPLLPGLVRTPEYVRGVFTEWGRSYDSEQIEAAAALRRGVLSLLLQKHVSISLVVSEQALDYRPAGLCEADMYYALNATLEAARHPGIDVRVLSGALDNQPRQGVSLFYTDGPAADRGHGFVAAVGEPCPLPVRESGMQTLEAIWDEVQNQALDAQASDGRIEDAVKRYQRAVAL